MNVNNAQQLVVKGHPVDELVCIETRKPYRAIFHRAKVDLNCEKQMFKDSLKICHSTLSI